MLLISAKMKKSSKCTKLSKQFANYFNATPLKLTFVKRFSYFLILHKFPYEIIASLENVKQFHLFRVLCKIAFATLT